MTRQELIQRRRLIPATPQQVHGPFRSFGAQLAAVVQAADQPSRPDPRLLQIRAAAGASEVVPADAGFLVQPEFSRSLVNKLYEQGELLSRMNRMTTVQDWATGVKLPGFDEQSRVDGSRFGGVRAYWANEADSITATRPKYRLLELTLKKLLGIGYTTSELLQDAGLLGQAMETAFVNEFTYKVEYASLFGSGAGQPLGVMNSAALITVAKGTQGAGTVTAQNIVDMWSRMWGPSRSRALWLANQEVEPQLLQLVLPVGTSGGTLTRLYVPTIDPDNQPYNLLLGRPVIPVEYCPTIGTTGDIIFIDPSEYLFLEKAGGIDTAISLHVAFLADETIFRFRWRCDGQPKWHTPVTPANGTLALSPYVALAARS